MKKALNGLNCLICLFYLLIIIETKHFLKGLNYSERQRFTFVITTCTYRTTPSYALLVVAAMCVIARKVRNARCALGVQRARKRYMSALSWRRLEHFESMQKTRIRCVCARARRGFLYAGGGRLSQICRGGVAFRFPHIVDVDLVGRQLD